jgi:hypothetical protein
MILRAKGGNVDFKVWRHSEFSEEPPVNTGKALFAQLMDFLPWSTFARIVVRYDGDAQVRTLRCAEQYRAMGFSREPGPAAEPTPLAATPASRRALR